MRTLRHTVSNAALRAALTLGAALIAGLAPAIARAQSGDPLVRAMEFNALIQRDDSGNVRIDGLEIALSQRAAMTSPSGTPTARVGGISPPAWSALGPANVGGRVRSVAAHPLIAGRLLAGSVSGGVFKRPIASGAWQPVNDFLPNLAITCLVHDPAVPNTVYACTGEGAYNPASLSLAVDAVRGSGILKSIDGGDSWSRIASTNPSTAAQDGAWNYVNRIAVKPADPNVLLAATHRGLYRSADGGVSWTLVYGALGEAAWRRIMDVKFDPSDASKVLLGEQAHRDPATGTIAGGAVAYSNDAGVTWTRLPLAGADRVDIAPSSPGTFIASVNANGGEIWRIQSGSPAWTATRLSVPGHLGSQGWYANAVWASPDGTRVLAGGASLRMSIDGGATFGDPIPGIVGRVHHVSVDPLFAVTGTIFVGTDTGVYTASGVNVAAPNAVMLAAINTGLAITQFNGAAGRAAVSPRIVGGTQHTGTFAWNGSGWNALSGGDGGRSAIDPVDPNTYYGSTPFLGIYRTLNGGLTFDYICTGLPDSACGNVPATPRANFIAPFAVDPRNPSRLYAGGESLWRTDSAKAPAPAWVAVKAPYLGASGLAVPVSAIGLTPGNADIAWAGHNNGALFRTQNATAAAPAWTRIEFTGLDAVPLRMVTRVLVDDQNPDRVYVTFGGYSTGNIVRTLDGGATWESVHGNLPAAPVRSIARHPAMPNLFYVGTEVGVFASENGGLTWSTSTEGPGTVSVEEVFWFDSATLVAATHGRGAFRAVVDTPGSVGTLQFSRTLFNAFEGSGAALWVTRVGGASGIASVEYATEGGSASAGTDFTAASGTLVWGAGDSTVKTIPIPVTADGPEGLESFSVRLQNSQGAVLGDPRSATVRILDPFPPAPEILAGWTLPPGTVNGWLITGDEPFEGAQSFRSGPIGANERAEVQVTTLFNDGVIAFAAKVSSRAGAHFLRFSIDGNVVGEWSGETGWEVASFPVTAGVHTIKLAYVKDGQPAAGLDRAWVDAVTLPLVAPGRIQFTRSSAHATEGGGALTLTVMRSLGSTGAASVSYATAPGTATAGADFTAVSGTLSFADGEYARTIVIPIAADSVSDTGEAFTIALSDPVNATLGAWNSLVVTVYDPWPDGGAMPAGWATPAGASRGWAVTSDSAFEGPQALRAEALADGQRAEVEFSGLFAAGTVSFARRVSSEPGDVLRFTVDGVVRGEWSGDVPWAVASFALAAGSHTLRWTYQKNASGSAGADTAWIDAVALPVVLQPAADNDADGIPNAVEIAEGRDPLAKDNDLFADARLFAMQQYRDFLGREGDPGGVTYYTNLIATGAVTRTQIIASFFNSPEFQGTGAPVVRLYFAFFNRIPDYPGLAFQMAQLRSGTALPTIANNFTLSPEFQATYGSFTDAQFVQMLYQNVLGRTAMQGEIDYHVNRLASGVTRGEVMVGFSESPEYVAAMSSEVYVTMMYVGMLRRAPDAAGFAYWVAQVDAGVPGIALVNGFFASAEYRSRFLP